MFLVAGFFSTQSRINEAKRIAREPSNSLSYCPLYSKVPSQSFHYFSEFLHYIYIMPRDFSRRHRKNILAGVKSVLTRGIKKKCIYSVLV